VDNVEAWKRMTLAQALRSTAVRESWKATISAADNPRIKDG